MDYFLSKANRGEGRYHTHTSGEEAWVDRYVCIGIKAICGQALFLTIHDLVIDNASVNFLHIIVTLSRHSE